MRQHGYHEICFDFWLNFRYVNLSMKNRIGKEKGMALTLDFKLYRFYKKFSMVIFLSSVGLGILSFKAL